ncbi:MULTISPECIES: ABC transporter substrate-binding protein [unclassified Vibrio]|uniref:ABC transporter substrate-binding protein n=1 Tax=unclassified Vibrio TaxID=2614977 RepID=UPI0013618266|nr:MULTISPECIES: ABC transporter substrate-binding protein [unclassified Vibrio]NAW59851.1 ABC transporter substrate-binding protein [Vibrio sp. V36_P2S2PM302]NAX27656.1 ABC transporter substrate-binding protein [Vibrio sp. V38_P2S17PM301]NAX30049.1 ABC transporter substrate-binding protein [Vibrio sp. V37_P2S8PM304]
MRAGRGVLLAGIVAVCLFAVTQSVRNQERADKVIRIAVSKTALSAPLIIAEQQGLFARFGLKVELIQLKGGVRCAQLLNQGMAEYATASESVLLAERRRQHDLVLLASFVESDNDLKLLSLASSPIQAIADLSQRRVGMTPGSASEFYFDAVVIASGLRSMQVNKVYLTSDKLDSALLSGEVDAVSVWEPHGYYAYAQTSGQVRELGIPGVYTLSFNLISQRSYAEQNTDEARRLLSALNLATQWIHDHPERARQQVATALGLSHDLIHWVWDDYIFRVSLSNALMSNLRYQMRWSQQQGKVDGGSMELSHVIDQRPFERAMQTEVPLE